MANLQSQVLNSVSTTNIVINEYNINSVIIPESEKNNGLYIIPSKSVIGRPTDITGYVLTATNTLGKVEWKPSSGGGSIVPGEGSVWFSDPAGLPDGDELNLNWDNTLKYLGIGTSTPQVELDVRGTVQTQNLALYDQTNISNKILIDAPTLPTSYTLILPQNTGTLNQVLTTDGGGVLSWTTQAAPNVPGLGNIWFSNPGGEATGSTNLVWDGANVSIIGGLSLSTNGIFTVSIEPSTLLASNIEFTLPPNTGTPGYVLTTDGTGVLSWTAKGGGPANVPGLGSIWFSDSAGDATGDNNLLAWNSVDSALEVTGIVRLKNTTPNTFDIEQSSTQVGDIVWTLPINNGTPGYVLTTDGTGILSWSAKGGGGSTVPGIGNVWFSDSAGNPIGSSGNFVWTEATKVLTAGDKIEINNSIFKFSITPGTLSSDIDWIIPATNGTPGYVLTNDGTGTLSWTMNGSSVTVPGTGRIWFSDPSGSPVGSPNIIWDTSNIKIIGGISLSTDGTFVTDVVSSGSLASDITLVLPPNGGINGQFLQTNGAGVTTWATTPVPTVPGQNRVWYSNATGNPIGNANLEFNGTELQVIGTVTSVVSSTESLVLREGLFTTTISPATPATANIAFTLPPNTGTNGQFLQTNGAGVLTWEDTTSSLPGGNNGNVQYKNGLAFAGSDDFSWNGSTLNISNGTDTAKVNTNTLDVGSASQFTVDSTGIVNCPSVATEDLLLVNGIGGITTMTSSPTQPAGIIPFVLPPDTGTTTQFLQTDGAGVTTWATPSLTAGGADTQVQFNNSGLLGGNSAFTWDGVSLDVGNINIDSSTNIISAVKFTATSDERLKTNIKKITNEGDAISQVNVYSYNINGEEAKSYGVIAQELEKDNYLKNLVHTKPDGYKSVDYIQLIPLLIDKIQSLENDVKNLKQLWN